MEKQQTKYMELFQMIGYFIGFPLLLFYSIFANTKHILVLIALIIIFGSRFIGYGIDRLQEKKKS